MWIQWKGEKYLDEYFPFVLEAMVLLPYRLLQESICLHLLDLLRKIMFVTGKGNNLIRK
jgi:hypothetical protein